ncbi:hypothetical protein [Neisseria sp.]|uniref:immunity protein Imm33 domain-containing protein n=1 Tax=Neisseria sp. TaxID=192066 RepID=UPI0026DAE03B|nr:hypothetical protein [Neisseria sp.]MDO4907234.1 hypothetical protein [Neisseria sp.]
MRNQQLEICHKYHADFYPSHDHLKVGIAHNVKEKNLYPIHGLRYKPEGDTTGWYIWAGDEFSEDKDFFSPLHVSHINEWRLEIYKFLALPPGYRFLIGENGYEDVWFDENLISD